MHFPARPLKKWLIAAHRPLERLVRERHVYGQAISSWSETSRKQPLSPLQSPPWRRPLDPLEVLPSPICRSTWAGQRPRMSGQDTDSTPKRPLVGPGSSWNVQSRPLNQNFSLEMLAGTGGASLASSVLHGKAWH